VRHVRLRFTVWRLMVVVAAAALVMGTSVVALRLTRLRATYLESAAEQARQESAYGQLEQSRLRMAEGRPLKDFARQARKDAVIYRKTAGYHAALKQKYLAAAARPWRSVEPDPPPPDLWDRAVYWSARGDHRRAVAAYEELLARNDSIVLLDLTLPPIVTGTVNPLKGSDTRLVLDRLAWALATCPEASLRDGKRAIALAAAACERDQWKEPSLIATLAAAYAESGDFARAVAMQNDAIDNLPVGDFKLKAFRERLQLYQNKKPYRDKGRNGM
jgi:tetratricopeptide (TPR) repeat protein